MSSLSMNLRNYKCDNGDNHVLNGILFEIYFDSHGELILLLPLMLLQEP